MTSAVHGGIHNVSRYVHVGVTVWCVWTSMIPPCIYYTIRDRNGAGDVGHPAMFMFKNPVLSLSQTVRGSPDQGQFYFWGRCCWRVEKVKVPNE